MGKEEKKKKEKRREEKNNILKKNASSYFPNQALLRKIMLGTCISHIKLY